MTTLRTTAARLIAATSLALAALGAQAIELRGFRGVAWGDDASRLGAATLVYRHGEVSCYQRAQENLLFGDSALTSVRYCFHEDRLFLVTLEAAATARALEAELARTYGRPDVRRGAVVAWDGRTSGARLTAQGKQAQLTLYASDLEPNVAQHDAAPSATTTAGR